MNQFGDLTNEEYRDQFLRAKFSKRTKNVDKDKKVAPPSSWDWRDHNAVTPVGNQNQCGSCWVFSVVEAVEGCHAIDTKKLVPLSLQQVLDCDTDSYGCNGGFLDNGFEYIIKNGGIDSAACYPYKGEDETCSYNKSCCASTLKSYKDVIAGSEDDLLAATFSVPVAVAIDASQSSFQFYSSGVYYEPACSSTNLDHTLLTVGWGVTSNGDKYYIVKNSWGTAWGNEGYILMARDRNNNCGIATEASYPIGCFDC